MKWTKREELGTNVKKPVLACFVGSKGKVKEAVTSRGFVTMGRVPDGVRVTQERRRARAEPGSRTPPQEREPEPEQEAGRRVTGGMVGEHWEWTLPSDGGHFPSAHGGGMEKCGGHERHGETEWPGQLQPAQASTPSSTGGPMMLTA